MSECGTADYSLNAAGVHSSDVQVKRDSLNARIVFRRSNYVRSIIGGRAFTKCALYEGPVTIRDDHMLRLTSLSKTGFQKPI